VNADGVGSDQSSMFASAIAFAMTSTPASARTAVDRFRSLFCTTYPSRRSSVANAA